MGCASSVMIRYCIFVTRVGFLGFCANISLKFDIKLDISLLSFSANESPYAILSTRVGEITGLVLLDLVDMSSTPIIHLTCWFAQSDMGWLLMFNKEI